MNLRHYILTRYNLGLYSDNVYGIQNPDEWMWHRWPLFEVCAHSILMQTNQNFSWVIAVDPKTPKNFVNEISNLTGATIITDIPQIYIRDLKITTDFVATSRIDNDDYYFPTFIDEIHDEFRKETEILDINHWQLELETNQFYSSGRAKPNSPFITLIEENGDLDTVYEHTHSDVLQKYPCRFVDEVAPLAVQVIHGENVSHKIIGEKL